MSTPKIIYTKEQIKHIRQTLIESSSTITCLHFLLAQYDIDFPPCTSAEEIATCLRILDLEGQYVQ
jgi:hypothetical protein